MNEFDKEPLNNQTSPENQSQPASSEMPEPAPSPEEVNDASAQEPTTPPSEPSAPIGGYSYKGEQLSDATTRVNPSPQWYGSYNPYNAPNGYYGANNGSFTHESQSQAGGTQPNEYEVSFDSASGRYTYTDHAAQTPPPPKPRKKKKGILALVLCATVLLSSLLGIGGGTLVATYLINQNKQEALAPNSTVQQSTVVKVNTGEVNYGAIADAAAQCYDSVVVIDTYYSEAYADAGQASGSGSGVIWTEDGYIVTCNHVIDGANIIRVTFTDGQTYTAQVVGTDAQTDLAVLKISATGLKAIIARGTPLVLGETAIAIGNPLGVLANSVSEGILSCLTRQITVEGQTMSLLQTTAAVNSGNSGGGLFDINGSLIGIVNAKSTGDSVEGLGFAIPIETVLEVCTDLIEQGYVSGRPRIGISVVTITETNYNLVFNDPNYADLKEYATKSGRNPFGGSTTQVVPGTYIVDASGVIGYVDGSDSLKYGDKLLYVGNTEIDTNTDVTTALSGYKAGDTIQLTVLRDQSQTIIIKLTLGEQGT